MTDPERADSSDMESIEDDDSKVPMYNPTDVLAALQNRFRMAAEMVNLSEPVKRKIKALKQLQLVSVNLEAKFYEEVHALEAKYHKMNASVYVKRSKIIAGVYEPTDEECEWKSDDEDEEERLTEDLQKKVMVTDGKVEEQNQDIKGIPDFWLTIFRNVGMLAEMIQEHDEPILKHLYDIQVIFLEGLNPMGFVLEFHFEPNEYFSNSVLTKEYFMKCTPEEDDPFSFEGPEIYKSVGCTIDWKKGKNVTVKTIKKSQKHKSRGAMRSITKVVQNDSFFNFFAPPVVPEDPEAELDEDLQALMTSDFEIGHYIRERIVPRAVLYFTGEGLEDEGDEFEDEEDDEEEENSDENIDEEDNDVSADGHKKNVQTRKISADGQECKQQ